MVIAEIMTKDPTTAEANATVGEVMATLHELDVRHLPIVDGRRLVGIVSDRDLRSFHPAELIDVEALEERQSRLATPVSDVMAADVVALGPETEVAEAVDTMLDQKVGALPVVDSRSDELVGILSYVDILRVIRDQL